MQSQREMSKESGRRTAPAALGQLYEVILGFYTMTKVPLASLN